MLLMKQWDKLRNLRIKSMNGLEFLSLIKYCVDIEKPEFVDLIDIKHNYSFNKKVLSLEYHK